MKYILFIIFSFSVRADVLNDPTYICGKNLFKYINLEGIPKIKGLQKKENLNSLKKEGLPTFEIPVKIINPEVDQKFFSYYKFLKGKLKKLPFTEKKKRVIGHILSMGKAMERHDRNIFNICINIFSSLNKICVQENKKCIKNFMDKNHAKYLILYKSFSINKYIVNIPKVKKLDSFVFKAIKEDNVSKFLKAYKKRMEFKQSRNKSTFYYIRKMVSNNAIKIINKGGLIMPRFGGALEFSGGDLNKFLNYHIFLTEEKTMITFLKKIRLRKKTIIDSLLKSAKKSGRKELTKYLISIH